jgi:hypothetical protein
LLIVSSSRLNGTSFSEIDHRRSICSANRSQSAWDSASRAA